MYYGNQMTIHGVLPTGGYSTVGKVPNQQYASFQFKPREYYAQFPEQYYWQSWYGQPQYANVYSNPLTNVSAAASNPYLVQPPIASIRFAKS